MFKRAKQATKVYLGFGVVVLIACTLGCVSWASQRTVAGCVKKADDANRLIQNALQCRQLDKDFMLRAAEALQ